MVVYLDLAFLANSLADALAFYMTARLSALPVRAFRVVLAAILGGIYGVLCLIPRLSFLGSLVIHTIVALLLVLLVFGKPKTFLRVVVLYYLLSCMLGGTFLSVLQFVGAHGMSEALLQINWKVFLLASSISFFLISIVFRGSAKHAVARELSRGKIILDERSVSLDVLLDTGHTLCDPYNGAPVLTVWYRAVLPLVNKNEQDILLQLEEQGCIQCAQALADIGSDKYLLIPYRAVGVECAMLLAFRSDELSICGKRIPSVTIALSATPLSDGGGYTALWGGERKESLSYASQNNACIAGIAAETGIDTSR